MEYNKGDKVIYNGVDGVVEGIYTGSVGYHTCTVKIEDGSLIDIAEGFLYPNTRDGWKDLINDYEDDITQSYNEAKKKIKAMDDSFHSKFVFIECTKEELLED